MAESGMRQECWAHVRKPVQAEELGFLSVGSMVRGRAELGFQLIAPSGLKAGLLAKTDA